MTLDVAGEIQSWTVIGDQDGQIQFDIKVDFANFPNFSSICGTERPQLGDINTGVQAKKTRIRQFQRGIKLSMRRHYTV